MSIKREERRRQTLERQSEQYRKTAEEIASLGYVLQGSIVKRWMACGKAACPCTDDPAARHGPYYAWTYKRGGKTVCVYLTAEQAAVCSQWIKNNRRLERLVAKLRAVSRRIAQLEEIPSK
jgi:hypothetical protein